MGALILEEDNGIIRKISGDIIKGMVTSGTHLRSLWPNSIDRDVYTKFPSPTLSMTEWNEKFCDYINGMQLERNSQKQYEYIPLDVSFSDETAALMGHILPLVYQPCQFHV